jgi:two-component system, OmpR family, sensor kinase
MRLRHRLALVFGTTTSLILATAFGFAFTFFRGAQQRQFDYALVSRAELEAEETLRSGDDRLHIEQETTGSGTELESLVKYGAMYRQSGQVLDATPTFQGVPPALSSLGFRLDSDPPIRMVDFPHRGELLHGVIVRVGPAAPHGRILLLAAPRGELDSDTRQMLEVMGTVLVAAAALALFLGYWLGVRMSRGIEAVAAVSRRVSEGELHARVNRNTVGSDDEVRALAGDLNRMIDRIADLLTAERRFVSNAAHELRSPLTAIRGELELALRRPRDTEEYKKAIEEALDSTNRLVTLAEDLLALARTGVVPASQEAQSLSVAQLVKDAVRASSLRAEQRRSVEVAIAPELFVHGRGTDLTRMLRNLIDNAVAHAPEGTAVKVSAEACEGAPERVLVAVEDTGLGVPEELRERLFEPFIRGESERATSGAGLGLAIAREIARANGGDLALEDRPGPTRFVATLPAGEVH